MDFSSFFGNKSQSKDIAKDRLKLVLVHDRVNCSTQILEMIKSDIIRVISNYIEVDEDELEMQITNTKSESNNEVVTVLYANIPIKNMRKAGSTINSVN